MIGNYPTCTLDGCNRSLAGLQETARFCTPAHKAKAHRQARATELRRLRAIVAERS